MAGEVTEVTEEAVGYVSYTWKGAPDGVIDANAGGNALIGLDEAIRYFNRKQARDFGSSDYQIPVKTGEGSWVAWILGIIGPPAVVFAASYAKKAAEKMAERDFSEIGFRDVARKSADALERLIELIKHTKKTHGWDTIGADWKENSTMIGIYNDAGDVMYLPVEYLKWYSELPKSVLKKITAPINEQRSMTVGVSTEGRSFRTVSLESAELRQASNSPNEENEFLFPELIHGEDVELEGLITRGNQETNTMGFQYKGHILNCAPDTGNIRRFKQAIFLHCRIDATINRHVGSLSHPDRRPTLIINQITPLEIDAPQQTSLFD